MRRFNVSTSFEAVSNFETSSTCCTEASANCIHAYMHIYYRAVRPKSDSSEETNMKALENYFKALSETNRLRIMNLLLHGELCVCDIQYVLDSPQPNVSRHIAYLKHSGLLSDRRDGLRMFYRIAQSEDPTLRGLVELLRAAFARSKPLQDDVRRLRLAIRSGHCSLSEWRPYAGLERSAEQQHS